LPKYGGPAHLSQAEYITGISWTREWLIASACTLLHP
jgi:hypothetical protein